MRTPSPKMIIITGPTCIGKTSAALALAERFGGAVIGADSMQIYRHMDIGTAKPDISEQARAPHYMIDIADPDDVYNAARYARKSRQAILEAADQGRVPLVVGGTGFYIKALLHGLFEAAPADRKIRERLKAEAETKGLQALYTRLKTHDAESAARIHPHDTYRIVRALEVYDLTGKPMSQYQQAHAFELILRNRLEGRQQLEAIGFGIYLYLHLAAVFCGSDEACVFDIKSLGR